MAKLKLIETIQTKLSTLTKKDGQLIVIRDNASLYVDLDGLRIYISDWIDVSTDEERLAMITPLSNKYYYVVETNKIWRYIGGSWVLVTPNSMSTDITIAGIDLKDDITADELIIALGIDDKVDKVDGKELSSNDYTDEDKELLSQNTIDIAELQNAKDITNTNSTTLYNSYDGGLRINKISGNTMQDSTPTSDAPVDIKSVVLSEIKTCGKNHFNVSTVTSGMIDHESGVLKSNGSWVSSDYIPCSAKKDYCCSQTNDVLYQYKFAFYDKNKTFISGLSINNGNIIEYAFTTPNDTSYMRVAYSIVVNSETVVRDNVQLELGTTATPYEPYTETVATLPEPITLNGIGDVKDYIDVNRGVLVQKCYKFIATSSMLNSVTNAVYVNTPLTGKSNTSALCTHYTNVNISGTGKSIYFKDEVNGTSVETYKAYLDSNEVEFAYKLAEPIETPLSEANIKTLNSLKTYDGATYVSTNSEVVADLDMDYGTSEVGAVALQACAEGCIATISTHPDSGVTAGDYASVTVDEKGHVTGGKTVLPISQGGTGATSGASVYRNIICSSGANESPQYVVGFDTGYSNNGYTTIQQLRNTMGLGNTTGALPVANGGTGATDAATARTNLDITPANIGAAASSHGTHVPSTCTTITDWNSATKTGWYMANGASNAPSTTGWYFGYVITHNSNYVFQEVYKFTTSTDAKEIPKYIRAKMNGTWGDWTNVTVAKSVPSDAKFTDTTYNVATTSANGLMSSTDKTKLDATNIAYATCSTAAATAAKVATISGNDNWSLKVGSIVVIKFTVTNTASNVTLNINNTGAKSIWYSTAVYTGNSNTVCGYANRYTTYMYDGTNWVWISNGADNNSTYSQASLGQGYGTCATEEATTAKVVTLSNYTLATGGIVAVKFSYAVPAGATMNINSKGAKAIYHRGDVIRAGVIKAGDLATFIYTGTYYHLLTVDRDVDTNTDTKVTQTVTTTNASYPLLLAPSGQTATTTTTSYFDSGVTLNPSTNTIAANVSGSASSLTTARTIDGVDFNGSAAITHYGTCSTAADTAAKTVALTGFKLVTGSRIMVKFTVTNTASSPTLNVNSTGAKTIVYRGAAISAGYLAANRVYEFVYDGTYWALVGDINTDTHYTTKLITGASATATANAAATNGNVYLNALDNTTVRNAHNIVGTGATTVTSDANGKITINSTNTDTKNTAGSTDSSSKLFLIGATSQAANPQTYSHNTAYVGTDGCLYSNSTKVSVDGHIHERTICPNNEIKVLSSNGNTGFTFSTETGMISTNSDSGLTLASVEEGNITLYGDAVIAYSYGTTTLVPIYGSQFLTSSSQRYKENIVSMTDEEAKKLLELNPVKYDYINKEQGVDCYGLIAEEVSEIMSYPVHNDSDGNPDAIDYSKFTPYLIKMVQIQNNEIQELKQRIDKLESMIEN